MIDIRTYEDRHFAAVEALWDEVFTTDAPWTKAAFAIPAEHKIQPDLFVVAEAAGGVVRTVMAGYDGHRGWLYAVAVKPGDQRKGFGSALLREAELRLANLGCTKANLQIRAGNEAVAAFYRTHNYQLEERISMGKRINS